MAMTVISASATVRVSGANSGESTSQLVSTGCMALGAALREAAGAMTAPVAAAATTNGVSAGGNGPS
jgi:hypothetical protein